MDVDDIPLGTDFTEFILHAVESADVTLVIIGPSWVGATTPSGRPRLHDAEDFVRLEIEAALRSNRPIVPILVENATFPDARQVPPSLGPLLMRQALAVRHESFQADVERLVRTLISTVSRAGANRKASIFGRLWRFIRGRRPSSASPEPGQETGASRRDNAEAPEEDILEQLSTLVQRARRSKLPVTRLLACVEEANCTLLDASVAGTEIEEHLRAFPAGNTRPIVAARLEVLTWKRAVESRQPRAFTEYLLRFPHGAHVERARSMRTELLAARGGFDPDMPRIFLNYRRVDSQDTVDRIYALLSETMPPQNLVMDVDKKSIVPGLSIEPQLRKLVSACDVMFAIFHSKWLEELRRRQEQHENGQQLDFVRAELKFCLERGVAMPLVPMLAEGVEHPRAVDLPEDIRDLSTRSSVHLSRDKFNEDVLTLFNRVVTHFQATRAALSSTG